ncbi:hypothetical protein Cdeb_00228 [Caldibacillus debilis GB1]|uniref:Uncharacterized protein n=1 Tax=Caldibacillus debilis GB1 TaxID=1339248 RepID=A0A420VHN6_9BACI|nr:hypothetical protein Cdeb_00228 [Caldibacillus debilis GB1]
MNRAEGVLRGNRCRRAKVQAQGPRLHGSPIPAYQAGDHPKTIRCARKGRNAAKRESARPGGKRRKIRGRPSGEPGPCSRKKSPSIPMERQSFRSNRPFAAVRPAERAGKQSPLPIKPSFRGNAYIFSRFRKNTGRCGRCAPFSVSVFASAFPRRISG